MTPGFLLSYSQPFPQTFIHTSEALNAMKKIICRKNLLIKIFILYSQTIRIISNHFVITVITK